MAEIAVGIDLGTSNSCVAIARGGKVEVLPNAYGEPVTASVVAFDENGKITVGNAAKANVIHDPINTVSSAKRLIGRYFFSEEVRKAQAVCSYAIVEGPAHSLRIQIRDEQFSLPEVSAMVLREMKTIAEEQLGQEVQKAVITVPAYFNDNQRQATRDAGRIAGLEVLRLLNEPTAAALAYGFGRGLTQRVAVYDLGGGTFDISVLEIGKDVFEVLSTCGDTYLGGDDFDDRMIDLLADEFMAREGVNLRSDPYALEKLKVAAENAKKGLSVDEQVEIRIPDIVAGADGEPRSIARSITREEYSALVMDLVQRTFKVCDEALQQANVIARDLGGVILVGGSTRLPVIREAVRDYFQQDPRVDVDPEEVVAMGAAIHAASLCSTAEQDSFLLDVTPLSLRIGVAGGLAEAVIGRNTPVPIEQTRTFTTYQDFQESVKIRVFQGESRQAEENEMLGQFEFSGFKKARRGEVRIDVTFEIDSDGIVNVTACDQETGQQASTQITLSSGLSEEEIEEIIDEKRTDRLQSPVAGGGDSPEPVAVAAAAAAPDAVVEPTAAPEPVAAATPAAVTAAPDPVAEEEMSDELELLPEPEDLLEEDPELEIDEDEMGGELSAEDEEADPNAATQPDQEPLPVSASPEPAAEVEATVEIEAAAEVELEPDDLRATAADNLEEIQPSASGDAIEVEELDGSPDDDIEIQTGAESLFDVAGTDLSEYGKDESER
jgi:molecular chaperone DnaK